MKRMLFAVAIAALFVANLSAAPITILTVNYGNSTNPNPQTLNLFNGTVGAALPVQPAAIDAFGSIAPGAYLVSGITINTTPYNTDPGPVGISPTFTITGTALAFAGDNGAVATFAFVPGTITVDEGGAADAVTAYVQLIANTGFNGIDFGPIGTIFRYDGSLQGTTFSPGAPGTVSGAPNSSSFTLTVANIPEPTSIAVFAVIGVTAGGFTAWRRRRKA